MLTLMQIFVMNAGGILQKNINPLHIRQSATLINTVISEVIFLSTLNPNTTFELEIRIWQNFPFLPQHMVAAICNSFTED